MKLSDDATDRLERAAQTAATWATRGGRGAARHSTSYMQVWLACFIAQGAYGLFAALCVAASVLVAISIGGGPDTSITSWAMDALRGDGSASTLWYVLAVLVGIGVLGLLGTFIVPSFIRGFVRVTSGGRVAYSWALIANLASWICVAALSTLLWLIPGAQPFVAFGVWLASSASCALLVRARITFPPTDDPTSTGAARNA